MVDPETGVNYISRDENSQIEYLPGLKVKVELNVNWLDDCTMELTFNQILENPNDLPIYDFILISEIIEIREDSYVMMSKVEDMDLVITREYFKIE